MFITGTVKVSPKLGVVSDWSKSSFKYQVEDGSTTDHISAFWDVMPTLAELTDCSFPFDIDGISLLSTLMNKGLQKERDYLYWEFHGAGGRLALREGDWKLVVLNAKSEGKQKIELYNLADDFRETNNLSEVEQGREKKMYDKMKKARVESETFPFYSN